MREAEALVRAFVSAGAQKIHLDASMRLGGDPASAVDIRLAAERTVALCAAGEDELRLRKTTLGNATPPVYVIGTEVPVPGGTTASGGGDEAAGPIPTAPEDFRLVVEEHRRLFLKQGLEDAWERVVAVVIQPGIEFDALRVHRYSREKARHLSRVLGEYPNLLFEGHSTDYQSDKALREMIGDGIAVLKVGPALTFALREALFGLSMIEEELMGGHGEGSHLVDTLLKTMREKPEHWKGYYPEDSSLSFHLKYAYSDRARYYWEQPEIAAAVRLLFENLWRSGIPPQLASQFLPRLQEEAAPREPERDPKAFVLAAVDAELARYERACAPGGIATQ
jgi:D-tagatose-1,6-bisphosphate aldolase subunit GatZ/KbaZ